MKKITTGTLPLHYCDYCAVVADRFFPNKQIMGFVMEMLQFK